MQAVRSRKQAACQKILIWLMHVIIMNQPRMAKRITRITERKPEGRRKMGRTKMGWLEDAENDLQELKVKRRMKRQTAGRLVTNRKGGQSS
jgi:hypothetical protein